MESNIERIKAKRAMSAQRREQEAAHLKEWTEAFNGIELGGDVTPSFQPSDPEATDNAAATDARANTFLAKYVDIFADVNTNRPVVEPAHPALIRQYMAVEVNLGISKFEDGTDRWLPGNRSLLNSAPTAETLVQLAHRYNSHIFGVSQYLDRDIKAELKRTGKWKDALYPEADNSRVVLPFWNGIDSYYGEQGGLTIAPYERSNQTNGWRYMNSSYPNGDGSVTSTIFLFGPAPKGYEALGATPQQPRWQPTLYAVRQVTSETQTFNEYFVGGMEALVALMADDKSGSATWEADRDARKLQQEKAAWQAAGVDVSSLQETPEIAAQNVLAKIDAELAEREAEIDRRIALNELDR